MRIDREMSIMAMQNLGWQAKRTKPSRHTVWEFRRPDTGGVWDLVRCKQDDLSMHFVARIAMQHGDAPELVREMQEAEERWLKSRFLGLYHRAAVEAEGGAA